jgi:soluble lytic murein transglycosylase-like protein
VLGPLACRTARRLALAAVCATAAVALDARPARAELLVFTNGRSLSVSQVRVDGDRLVVGLRAGGEMALPARDVVEIRPDEVPYSEDSASQPVEGAAGLEGLAGAAVRDETLLTHPTYEPLIRKIAEQEGVDPSLVKAVVQVESGYAPRARSRRGAVGLMQVLPATGRQYGRVNLYDPSSNLRVGVRHLRSLLDRFPVTLALAAYNAGQAAVERYGGIPPFPETLAYVTRVRRLLEH